ncbi:hypothetical protein HKD27_11325 [Gluconobacter sp. R75690]|uniref:5' nucleotidase, NT5C type n=1 Tax=Gluconobacter TaxID=441 RepID=UPI00188A202A|nr:MULTISPECIES: hypothetical protein [unclassified Gluconobacter]MBF0851507.1 hypothetical protein [Gluconobacter sp. R75690]MBF0880251.1 hypothetical protein [Gluconobacter sp. R75828]
MTPFRLRLAVDMDEVLADALSAQRAWFRRTCGYEWTDAELRGRRFRDLVSPEDYAAMEAMLHQGDFFASLDVMPGAQEAISALCETCEVFITTAAMEYPASCAPKFAWLREHFPCISPLNIVFCGDKSILAADVMIDDNLRHFRRFQGQGVLFTAPHNALETWSPRADNWQDVLAIVDRIDEDR